MAGSVSGDYGVGRSSEVISSGQSCQSREALAEWRSSKQLENGTLLTSPPCWDTDDDDCEFINLISLESNKVCDKKERHTIAPEYVLKALEVCQDYSVLDKEEKVDDGFYDMYRLSMDSANQGKIPSLADLQKNHGDPVFEVVVNRAIDYALEELEQIAHCLTFYCLASEVDLLIQRLADLVTEHVGGLIRDANI